MGDHYHIAEGPSPPVRRSEVREALEEILESVPSLKRLMDSHRVDERDNGDRESGTMGTSSGGGTYNVIDSIGLTGPRYESAVS